MTERASSWAIVKPKTALRRLGNGGGTVPIKAQASQVPKQGYVPAFSASGQDVWLPHATHFGDALILSAVGARCGKVFSASGRWALVANTTALSVSAGHSRDFWFYRCNAEGWWIREGSAQPFVRVRATLDRPEATPSLEEQELIVRYLDHAELGIAKAIAAKKKLVALLDEHRSTVIDSLLLRGLDVGVKIIESSSSWMGEIPAHWEVVPSKSLFAHRKERTRPGDEMLTASQSRGILTRDDFMSLEGRRVMQVFVGSDILKHVEPNDFVISMRSFQGGIEWSRVRGCISSAYVMLIPGSRVHCEYFALLLKSRAYVSALRTTSDLVRDGQALRYTNFCQIQLPLPPLDEQRRIAVYVAEKLANLDRAIAPVLKEIALLNEYRTRLISDVVSGKLDVREEAAKLPMIDPMELATVALGENGDDKEATDDN